MGCGSSALGCKLGREVSSQQPSPRLPPPEDAVPTSMLATTAAASPTATPTASSSATTASATAVASPASGSRPVPASREVSGQPGLEPEAAVGAAGATTAAGGGCTASVLRYGSTAALATDELAPGQSQLERGYHQLPLGLPLKEWDDLHVRMWLLTLPAVLRPYTDMLCSPGGLLLEWSDELLSEAGVANAFHRRQLLEYVRQLQADVAARQRQEQPGPLVPAGFLPGSIDSPRGGSGGGGKLQPRDGGNGLNHNHKLKYDSGSDDDRGGLQGCDSDPGLGSLTPAKSAGLRRMRSSAVNSAAASDNGGDDDGGGGAGVGIRGIGGGGGAAPLAAGGAGAAGRVPKDVADALAEYDQGLLETGLASLKAAVAHAGSMCPWPGDAAAALLSGLLDLGERALVNRRNWRQLNARAVDLLQLVASNRRLQADATAYRSLMHRLINTLKGIREYFSDFTNRNWLSRIVGVGRDQQMFSQLWEALGALVADASLGLQVAAAGGQQAAAEALQRLANRQARYDDEEGRLRQRIAELGGVEALVREPGRLLAVAEGLRVGEQITLHKVQEAVGLLEANRSEGVHSLIPHPQLRVLWRRCFAQLQDVSWELWWEAFPAELARVPVAEQVITALTSRLSAPRRRSAFQRRVDISAAGRISVVDLRRSVPPDADLREAVEQLTEGLSTDGGSTGDVLAAAAAVPPLAAGVDVGGAVDATTATESRPAPPTTTAMAPPPPPPVPYSSLEPRCCLPPLDSDRFVGRDGDVRQVSELLVKGSGAAASSPDRSPVRPHAVCIVAESGMGKSTLAVAVARRLWGGGELPGGAYLVDLRGADCRAEVAARFAGALGVGKAEHGDAAATASVSLALQALAAHGALLLVLDGVDCLYDSVAPSDVAAAEEAQEDAPSVAEAADIDATGQQQDAGGGAGGGELGSGLLDSDPEMALSELLSLVPAALVLLTATQPVELRAREVEGWWLGPLPEPAGVALVQDLARCLTCDEARQLAAGCGLSPLALRLAASAVAAGALTLRDAISRARTAATLAAFSMRVPTWSAAGGSPDRGGDGFSPCASGRRAGGGGEGSATVLTGQRTGSPGPSVLMPLPATPQLLRSQSPLAVPPGRYRSSTTPLSCGCGSGESSGSGAATVPYGFTQYFVDSSTAGINSSSPTGGRDGRAAAAATASGVYGTPSSAPTPSPGSLGKPRANRSFGRSMSFLLRVSNTSGDAIGVGSIGNGGGNSLTAPSPLLQPSLSGDRTGGGASGRTYGSGAAVAAALLEALNDEHRTALVQLSIMPGPWDEDTASALLGQPPYAVRALLDVLVGYSFVVSRGGGAGASGRGISSGGAAAIGSGSRYLHGGGGLNSSLGSSGARCYSLMPGVLDAARALLAELDAESRVALQCRFVGHVASQFMRADRLYGEGAVRAAMQLASELRQDVQAMLLVAARCTDPERMVWGTLGPARLSPLAASPLFAALALDASAEVEAFWGLVQRAAEAADAAKAGAGTGRYAAVAAVAARALAQTLYKQARYEEAESAWRGALQAAQRLHGPDSQQSAACHSGLGLALSALRRYPEAEEQHTAALRLRRAALGERHVDVAASLSDLARVMRNTGRYRQAEEMYAKVLQVRLELLGPDHPAVADSYTSAGIAAGLQRRYLEEELCYREALAIRQRALGAEHPEVAQALNNIGTALSSQGRHAAAEQVFHEALAIKRRVLGPGHHSVGTTLNNIARALRYQSKLPEAEAACRQALAVLEAALAPSHPSVTTALSNLAFLLRRQGKEAEAAALQAALIRPRWAQGQHPQLPHQPAPVGSPRRLGGGAGPVGQGGPAALQVGKEPAAVTAAAAEVRFGKPPLAPQGSLPRAPQQPASVHSPRPPQQAQKERQPLHLPPQAWLRKASERAPVPKPLPDSGSPLALMASRQGSSRAEGLGPPLVVVAASGAAAGAGGRCSGSGVGSGGLDSGGLDTGPRELSSRLDASSLQRQLLVEAARAVQRDLQGGGEPLAMAACVQPCAGASKLRQKTSAGLEVRTNTTSVAVAAATTTSSTTALTETRASTASSRIREIRESDPGAFAVTASTPELLSSDGASSIKMSGTIPARPDTASPTISGSMNKSHDRSV